MPYETLHATFIMVEQQPVQAIAASLTIDLSLYKNWSLKAFPCLDRKI
ncbi:MAG: hypothetical protein V7L20_05045 [Nostoc sp.]